ncbi:hypothetical protein O988_07656 [Pseudogymnoascus sp. VKM F-3808]|nr:hypothetical protein O988_07656 [Pseudogymnoascus sp. VKM F-3808]
MALHHNCVYVRLMYHEENDKNICCRPTDAAAPKLRSGGAGILEETFAITEQTSLYHNRVKVACCCSVSFASTLVHLGEPDPIRGQPETQ